MTRSISEIRKAIDINDTKLLEYIKNRNNLVGEMGIKKQELGLKPLDKTRWQEVLTSIKTQAASEGLSPEMIEDVWNIFHAEALRIESRE